MKELEYKKLGFVAVAKPFEPLQGDAPKSTVNQKYYDTQNRIRFSVFKENMQGSEKKESKVVYQYADKEKGVIIDVWVGENDEFLGFRLNCDVDDNGPTKAMLNMADSLSEKKAVEGIASSLQQLNDGKTISIGML